MVLENKTAVVYGACGRIGAATARGFAAGGARCFLVGLDPGRLDAVAAEIRATGGRAETALVDVSDEAAVNDHADATAARAGRLDIGAIVVVPDEPFRSLIDVPVPAFVRAVDRTITAQLLTTRAVARHMVAQGSGLVLFLGGPGGRCEHPGPDGVQVAVVDALCRQWACELGPYGVRVVSLVDASATPMNLSDRHEEWRTVPCRSTS